MKKLYTHIIQLTMLMLAIFTFTNITKSQNASVYDYDIYLFNVKEGTTTRVTSIPNSGEFNVTWSPNGKKIAHDVVFNSPGYGQSIYITDMNTGFSNPLLGAEGGDDASWSPDGSRIAFNAYDPVLGVYGIFSVPASGGTKKLLREYSYHVSWSPVGNMIAFYDFYSGYIKTKNLVTGVETFVAPSQYPGSANWSNNGEYIAYLNAFPLTGISTVKVDLTGNPLGTPVQITSSGYGPKWSVNNKTILYFNNPGNDFDIYTIPATGGIPTRVCGRVDQVNGDYDPDFSQNSKLIAYSGYTSQLTIPAITKGIFEQQKERNELFRLDQNFPNPFNGQTKIGFSLQKETRVTLSIFNAMGQKIITLIDANYPRGSFTVNWNGKNDKGIAVLPGLYFYQLIAGEYREVMQMNLGRR